MNKENCALKLVDEIILYYDARSKKHQMYRYCWAAVNVRLCIRLRVKCLWRWERKAARLIIIRYCRCVWSSIFSALLLTLFILLYRNCMYVSTCLPNSMEQSPCWEACSSLHVSINFTSLDSVSRILSAWRATCSTFHTEHLQILGASSQNLFDGDLWNPCFSTT